MVFVLLYFPCVSTLVVLYKECGIRWAAASFVITSVLSAWAAKVVYKVWGGNTMFTGYDDTYNSHEERV